MNFQTRTPEEVIARYSSLTPKVKANLTDFYNCLLGLRAIAYGTENQFKSSMHFIQKDISSGREPFIEDPLATYFRNQVNSKERNLTQLDLEHITEVTDLMHNLNIAAKSARLDQETARKAYDLLIPYLYGRKDGESK